MVQGTLIYFAWFPLLNYKFSGQFEVLVPSSSLTFVTSLSSEVIWSSVFMCTSLRSTPEYNILVMFLWHPSF